MPRTEYRASKLEYIHVIYERINLMSLKHIWCTLSLIVITVTAGLAAPTHLWPQTPRTWGQTFQWTKIQWSGDNAPYHAVRVEIDKAIHSDPSFETSRTRYGTEALKKPNDSLAFFRWAYATCQEMLNDHSAKDWHAELNDVNNGFYAHGNAAHTYDYDRLRYIVGELIIPNNPTIPFGRRLLAVDPDDYEVGYSLSSAYLNVCNPARITEALAICKHLISVYPGKASLYALTGLAYVLWYNRDQNPANAKAVVANYEKYLKLAPASEPFRKRAEQIIEQYKDKTDR